MMVWQKLIKQAVRLSVQCGQQIIQNDKYMPRLEVKANWTTGPTKISRQTQKSYRFREKQGLCAMRITRHACFNLRCCVHISNMSAQPHMIWVLKECAVCKYNTQCLTNHEPWMQVKASPKHQQVHSAPVNVHQPELRIETICGTVNLINNDYHNPEELIAGNGFVMPLYWIWWFKQAADLLTPPCPWFMTQCVSTKLTPNKQPM